MSSTSIDIPFLGQTEKHAFIGLYEAVDNNATINKVRVIDKTSGKTVQVIDPNLYGFLYDHDLSGYRTRG